MIPRLVRSLTAAATVSLAGCAPPAAAPPGDPAAAREALMAADRAFAALTAARGLDGWMSVYASDAVRMRMGRDVVQGLDSVRAFDAGIFEDSTTRLEWVPTAARVFSGGDLGVTTGRSALVRVAGAARDTLRTGSYVTMWRLAEGRWQVIMDTGALDPAR